MESKQRTKLDVIEASLAFLKAVRDPRVRAEAESIEKNVKAIMSLNKPIIGSYADQLKKFDQGVVAKYGVPMARLIEFGLVASVAAKIYFAG